MERKSSDDVFIGWLRREAEDLLWMACEEQLRTDDCPDVSRQVAALLRRVAAC